ncbi:unnamed protein product [Caenorhabditis auriculariae]|uniref:Major facilitator superfamily (MFS) profile domain-containing protein n=1 Tax=Caenorhabditis auriculariae TaxID=2777116 RepID=A0A8S1HHI2_9PELO|nr:unnamed protein product [Caenorhabditis auriculariae]
MKIYDVAVQDVGVHTERKWSWPTKTLLFSSLTTFLAGGFHFGFQISAINPLADVLQSFLLQNFQERYSLWLSKSDLTFVWSSVAGSLFIGAALGAVFMIWLIRKIGPRKSLLFSAIVLLIASPLAGVSYYVQMAEVFILARMLAGIGIGMGTTAQGVFLTEISPVSLRGWTGALGGLMGNFGFFCGAALGLSHFFGTSQLWPCVFFLEALPALLHIVLNVTTFHESPKFLLEKGDCKRAQASLQAYGSSDAEKELERLSFELKTRPSCSDFVSFLRDKASTRALSLSVALNVAVAFSGIMAMSFFGTFLLQEIGFSESAASLANCLSVLSGTSAALLATFAFEAVGRRKMVIISLLLLTLINATMMLLVFLFESTKQASLGWPFLALFIVFLFVFSVGLGPAALFLGAELAPSGTTATVQAISVGSQYVACFISPILYLPLNASVGPLAFMVFIVPLSLTAVYIYCCLPETRGKSTQEITEELRQ